ncbi:MAG TPA: hypothetical protein VGL70_13100 [Candidatus Binatia bacterium]
MILVLDGPSIGTSSLVSGINSYHGAGFGINRPWNKASAYPNCGIEQPRVAQAPVIVKTLVFHGANQDARTTKGGQRLIDRGKSGRAEQVQQLIVRRSGPDDEFGEGARIHRGFQERRLHSAVHRLEIDDVHTRGRSGLADLSLQHEIAVQDILPHVEKPVLAKRIAKTPVEVRLVSNVAHSSVVSDPIDQGRHRLGPRASVYFHGRSGFRGERIVRTIESFEWASLRRAVEQPALRVSPKIRRLTKMEAQGATELSSARSASQRFQHPDAAPAHGERSQHGESAAAQVEKESRLRVAKTRVCRLHDPGHQSQVAVVFANEHIVGDEHGPVARGHARFPTRGVKSPHADQRVVMKREI